MVMGKMGKTYRCLMCGQEVKVTKEGVGVLMCCQRNMRHPAPGAGGDHGAPHTREAGEGL